MEHGAASGGRRGVVRGTPRPWVVRIGADPPCDVDSVGGKGASLDRLARLGHDVPAAIAITADAFRAQIQATVERCPEAAEWLGRLPDESSRRALIEAFETAPTRPELRTALRAAVATLVAGASGVFVSGGDAERDVRLAVRSSAIDEDGANASFAGLHETELGLVAADVEAAVRRCWASLWSERAMAYRSRRGLACTGLAMAVVVQVLVPAAASVVVFTRHPVTGRDDHILITAIRGLGEPMVSGTATPDTLVVERATRSIVEHTPGSAGSRLFLETDGLVERLDQDPGPVLDASALHALVDLAVDVDDAYGDRVDIEAARANGRWFLLQARPITTR